MNISRTPTFGIAAALAAAFALTVAAPPADAGLFDKVRDAFKNAGGKIKEGFDKVGKGFKDAGGKIKEGFDQVGKKIKEAGGKVASFFGKIKDKILDKIKAFGGKLLDGVKGLFSKAVSKILDAAVDFVTFKISDIKEVYGPDGKPSRSKIREIIIRRVLSTYLLPTLVDKTVALIGTAYDAIKPALDAAVSAIVTAAGSIPVGGGIIAGVIHMAYSVGTSLLRSEALRAVAKWVAEKVFRALETMALNYLLKKVVAPGAEKGLEWLAKVFPAFGKKLDEALAGFYDFFEKWVKPPAGATAAQK
jgi:hypothetical protein